MTLQNTDIKKK
uniref:Uncharacterized protein n=1 Tax=Anguilla anguilla TaxID=7936 RepID=A0A0E9XST5_ANGAN